MTSMGQVVSTSSRLKGGGDGREADDNTAIDTEVTTIVVVVAVEADAEEAVVSSVGLAIDADIMGGVVGLTQLIIAPSVIIAFVVDVNGKFEDDWHPIPPPPHSK